MSEKTEESKPATQEGPLARLLSSIKFLVDPVLPVENRRDDGRVECSYKVSYLSETNRSGEGELMDISRRGMRLRTSEALAKGRIVSLLPPKRMEIQEDFAPLMARVVWACKDTDGRYLAGLLLPAGSADEETWVEELLTRLGYPNDPKRRKHVRAEANLEGVFRLTGGPEAEVLVMNLGMGGALVRADDRYEKDSAFTLLLGPAGNLPEIELQGVVLKSMGEESGGHNHSVRFGPLERRRHDLLKEYIVYLLEEPEVSE